jgi:hypothetical protein
MALKVYLQLVYMALATWTTHMVVAQNVGEALSRFYERTAASPPECAPRERR